MWVIVLIVFVVFQTPFGLIRMTVVVIPFLYVGTLISKNFAALLEEHDIFVPEDDDDDDWTTSIHTNIFGKVLFSPTLLVILTTTFWTLHLQRMFLLLVKVSEGYRCCKIIKDMQYYVPDLPKFLVTIYMRNLIMWCLKQAQLLVKIKENVVIWILLFLKTSFWEIENGVARRKLKL